MHSAHPIVFAMLLACVCAVAPQAHPAQRVFDLRDFQRDSGAIALAAPSAIVDPYFASKALLVAHASGLDVRVPALRWIDWMLGKQLPDGRFQRYVLHDVRDVERLGEIAGYAPADADDALLAVWIELLSKVGAPCEAQSAAVLPPAWTRSLELATQALARLMHAESGIYHISAQQPVGLLMDNVEVFGAWRHVADFYAGCGEGGRALAAQRRAAALAQSIDRTFWQRAQRRYSASTQVRESFEFYPDGVAQFYPLLGELPNRRSFESADFRAWLRAHAGHWRAAAKHDFPWGLVAVAAQRAGARDVAACWLHDVDAAREREGRAREGRAGERRPGAGDVLRWNVLEEAAYQSLRHELGDNAHSAVLETRAIDDGSNCLVRGDE